MLLEKKKHPRMGQRNTMLQLCVFNEEIKAVAGGWVVQSISYRDLNESL